MKQRKTIIIKTRDNGRLEVVITDETILMYCFNDRGSMCPTTFGEVCQVDSVDVNQEISKNV